MREIKVTKLNQVITIDKPGKYVVLFDKPHTSGQIFLRGSHQLSESVEYGLQIHHLVSQTKATTIMKSVVGKGGSVKLVGKIVIDEGASGCSSFLTQRILLLDSSARGEAVPELEILNNDVKCSHAASISSIPEEQLHYLMARGLSEAKATRMIAEGFLRG